MSYRTLEVELRDGVVHPAGSETLPAQARALLTILAPVAAGGMGARSPGPAATSADLADRWPTLDKLPPEEAEAFARDLESAHNRLPAPKGAWD